MTPSLTDAGLVRTLLALVERRIGASTVARLYALADQGSSGLANIIAFALLGRALPVAQFGAIGTTIGLYYFVAGFHRSAVVLPFTVDRTPDIGEAMAGRDNSGWWWLGAALTVALTVATALVGAATALASTWWPACRWMAEPLLLAAVISPAMLLWEFARRWLYKIERADIVSVCSLLYLVLLGAGAWTASHLWPSALAAALVWVGASLGALLLAWPVLRPGRLERTVAARLLRDHHTQAGWLAATNLPYAVFSSASIVVLIAIMVGPVAAALFSAARTLNNPAISIVSAIDSIDKPRAARAFTSRGLAGLRSVVGRCRLSIALATGLYLLLIAIFAKPLIQLAFQGRYAGLEHEVRMLAIGFFLFGLNLPSETMLIVLHAGRLMLGIRIFTAVATVLAMAFASSRGVAGMAVAFAMTQAANLLLLRWGEATAARHVGQATT